MSDRAARHNEIARRYESGRSQKRGQFSITAVRIAELKRLFASRYGRTLPDDDSGRDDAFVMSNHLALRPDAERRIQLWLDLWAPWMGENEVRSLTARVVAKPIRWRADKLARRLNLHELERQSLGITTIGAVDVDKETRLTRRKERARLREQRRRRAQGAQERAEYEARSIARQKPWEALGISRRTWYRRHNQTKWHRCVRSIILYPMVCTNLCQRTCANNAPLGAAHSAELCLCVLCLWRYSAFGGRRSGATVLQCT